MKYFLIVIYFLFILLIQIEQEQAVPLDLSSSDDVQNEALSSWYSKLNDLDYLQYHPRRINHYFKRYMNDILLPERQRRFGNTKYGRSLPDE